MKFSALLAITLIVVVCPSASWAQQRKKASEEDFVKERPAVGDPFPDVVIYDPEGKEIKTSSLRGHYTVLTFGCLT